LAIEDLLSSKGRVKILRILTEVEELNISGITRRAELNYTATRRHLEALKDAGLVGEKRFGKIRIFYFNREEPRARAVKNLIVLWNQTERNQQPNHLTPRSA